MYNLSIYYAWQTTTTTTTTTRTRTRTRTRTTKTKTKTKTKTTNFKHLDHDTRGKKRIQWETILLKDVEKAQKEKRASWPPKEDWGTFYTVLQYIVEQKLLAIKPSLLWICGNQKPNQRLFRIPLDDYFLDPRRAIKTPFAGCLRVVEGRKGKSEFYCRCFLIIGGLILKCVAFGHGDFFLAIVLYHCSQSLKKPISDISAPRTLILMFVTLLSDTLTITGTFSPFYTSTKVPCL